MHDSLDSSCLVDYTYNMERFIALDHYILLGFLLDTVSDSVFVINDGENLSTNNTLVGLMNFAACKAHERELKYSN